MEYAIIIHGIEKGKPDPIRNIHRVLKVARWKIPGIEQKKSSTEPDWWRGDEEASQNFLRAMGVTIHG